MKQPTEEHRIISKMHVMMNRSKEENEYSHCYRKLAMISYGLRQAIDPRGFLGLLRKI